MIEVVAIFMIEYFIIKAIRYIKDQTQNFIINQDKLTQ